MVLKCQGLGCSDSYAAPCNIQLDGCSSRSLCAGFLELRPGHSMNLRCRKKKKKKLKHRADTLVGIPNFGELPPRKSQNPRQNSQHSLISLRFTGYWAPRMKPYSRNSLDPYYLVPHYYLGHIPSLFGSRWVVGYQVVGVLRVPRTIGPISHVMHIVAWSSRSSLQAFFKDPHGRRLPPSKSGRDCSKQSVSMMQRSEAAVHCSL